MRGDFHYGLGCDLLRTRARSPTNQSSGLGKIIGELNSKDLDPFVTEKNLRSRGEQILRLGFVEYLWICVFLCFFHCMAMLFFYDFCFVFFISFHL